MGIVSSGWRSRSRDRDRGDVVDRERRDDRSRDYHDNRGRPDARIGCQAGAASATISTAAAMMAGPVVHAPAPTMAAAAARRGRRVGAS